MSAVQDTVKSANAASTLDLQVDSASLTIEIDKSTVTDNSSPVTGNTMSTTTITGAGANGYDLITKLSESDNTTSIMQETGIALAIIEPDGTIKFYDAVNNDDIALDTGTDVTSRVISVTVPETVAAGTYALTIVYEAEDVAVPAAPNPLVCKNADPNSGCKVDIDDNMIPLKYTGTTTAPEWQVANPAVAGDWYDYENAQWANAATVTAASLSIYLNLPNTVVNEADILGYFVYIPRYAYEVQRYNAWDKPVCGNGQLGINYADANCDANKYQARFDIRFEQATDVKKTAAQGVICTTPPPTTVAANAYATGTDYRTGCGVSRSYGAATGTTWQTHPGFTLGGAELNGLWVGKFETTGPRTAPTVMPNQHANISDVIGIQYSIAKALGVLDAAATGGNTVAGLTQNSHNLNAAKSHDMKNSEWGAAAYLANSIYGSNGAVVQMNTAYPTTSADADGSSSRYGITGCGPSSSGSTATYTDGTALNAATITSPTACSANTSRAYYGTLGRLASTTQNPWGIYDMSAGAREHVMGNYNGISTGMTTLPAADYRNTYLESDGFNSSGTKLTWMNTAIPQFHNFDYCTLLNCGGQGTYETTSVQSISAGTMAWGSDLNYFVRSISLGWITRGGHASYGNNGGLWSTDYDAGADATGGFRVVLWL